MDSLLLSIHHNDPVWIIIAFLFGFLVKLIGLPPLIGFLVAGFVLNGLGAEGGDFLNALADLGITLLLFTIGLKLKLRELARPEVWGVAILHMIGVVFLLIAVLLTLSYTSISLFSDLNLHTAALIAFALSFSSTVFAIKVLDELGAINTNHGRIAIGILVVQDLVAVIYLAASSGKVPSIWAMGLIMLIFAKPLIGRILNMVGHGELLILFGIALALGGADIFELVGIKGDLGALIFGMLLANHPKSNELSKALLGFKDLFLVGFFLSVGMTTLPGWIEVFIAIIFIALLPLKTAAYFSLLSLFNLRASTSWRTSLNLANYSEFGLIVGAIAASQGLLPGEWLAVLAIVLALSFIVSAPLIGIRDNIYQAWRSRLKEFERPTRLAGEEDILLHNVEVLIFGMGRMGSSAYEAIKHEHLDSILGVEVDTDKVKTLSDRGFNVIVGDATNPDFWTRTPGLVDGLQWVLLTLPTHSANVAAATWLKKQGYLGNIAATSKYPEEEKELRELNVDIAFNIYTEAGIGFSRELGNSIAKKAVIQETLE